MSSAVHGYSATRRDRDGGVRKELAAGVGMMQGAKHGSPRGPMLWKDRLSAAEEPRV
jgi:hypothetical protein